MTKTEITKDEIADMRGGYPECCDFCNKPTPPDFLEPEEGGEWACLECLERWSEEDRERDRLSESGGV